MIELKINDEDTIFISKEMYKHKPEPKGFHLVLFNHVTMKEPLPTVFHPTSVFDDCLNTLVLSTGKEDLSNTAIEAVFIQGGKEGTSGLINIGDSIAAMTEDKIISICKIANKIANSNNFGNRVKSVTVIENKKVTDYTDTVRWLDLN